MNREDPDVSTTMLYIVLIGNLWLPVLERYSMPNIHDETWNV